MVKVSGLPPDSSVDGNHYVVLNDPTGPTTKRGFLSVLAAFFFNQDNIPDGTGSPRTRALDFMFDFIASGLVWSGDNYNSTRNASMTAGVIYINGRRISLSAVAARLFTASRDTYVDVLDNGNGTGTLVYTEVTNNAASPTLAANSVRLAIIVTGASSIVDAGSVNMGEEFKALPIVSSVAYAVTDSLGNLINPRDPMRRILGCRQAITTQSSIGGEVALTGLSVPFRAPGNRKVKATLAVPQFIGSGSTTRANASIKEGVGYIKSIYADSYGGANGNAPFIQKVVTPSAGLHTYNGAASTTVGTMQMYADANGATAQLIIELE